MTMRQTNVTLRVWSVSAFQFRCQSFGLCIKQQESSDTLRRRHLENNALNLIGVCVLVDKATHSSLLRLVH